MLTTGTFLRGVIHIGDWSTPACTALAKGPPFGLARTLDRLNLPMGRAEDRDTPASAGSVATIDWSGLAEDPGDTAPEPFSTLTTRIPSPQLACRVTATTLGDPHAIIRGKPAPFCDPCRQYQWRWPALLPFVEDKVKRFAARDHHNIFLEP